MQTKFCCVNARCSASSHPRKRYAQVRAKLRLGTTSHTRERAGRFCRDVRTEHWDVAAQLHVANGHVGLLVRHNGMTCAKAPRHRVTRPPTRQHVRLRQGKAERVEQKLNVLNGRYRQSKWHGSTTLSNASSKLNEHPRRNETKSCNMTKRVGMGMAQNIRNQQQPTTTNNNQQQLSSTTNPKHEHQQRATELTKPDGEQVGGRLAKI